MIWIGRIIRVSGINWSVFSQFFNSRPTVIKDDLFDIHDDVPDSLPIATRAFNNAVSIGIDRDLIVVSHTFVDHQRIVACSTIDDVVSDGGMNLVVTASRVDNVFCICS